MLLTAPVTHSPAALVRTKSSLSCRLPADAHECTVFDRSFACRDRNRISQRTVAMPTRDVTGRLQDGVTHSLFTGAIAATVTARRACPEKTEERSSIWRAVAASRAAGRRLNVRRVPYCNRLQDICPHHGHLLPGTIIADICLPRSRL